MKILTNRMGSFVTSDDVADAVVAYHLALVARREVDLVGVPVLDGQGTVRHAEIAVGWLTLIEARAGADFEALDTARDLHARARALGPTPTD